MSKECQQLRGNAATSGEKNILCEDIIGSVIERDIELKGKSRQIITCFYRSRKIRQTEQKKFEENRTTNRKVMNF